MIKRKSFFKNYFKLECFSNNTCWNVPHLKTKNLYEQRELLN